MALDSCAWGHGRRAHPDERRRCALERRVHLVADAVKVTLGPVGRRRVPRAIQGLDVVTDRASLSLLRYLKGLTRATAALLPILVLVACGGNSALSTRVVQITERDFTIRGPHELRAGLVRFVVTNQGPVSHELIVVRAAHGRLPMRKDGFTIAEGALESRTVGALGPAGPGSRRNLDVRLRPGRYVLFCNMAGHYMSGMSWAIRVS